MPNKKNDVNVPFQQAFNKIIAEKLPQFLPGKLDGQFVTATYPAGFNYGITYGSNGYYNEMTLSTLDSTIQTDSDEITSISNQKLSNLYYQVLKNTAYVFSQSTQQHLTQWDNAAESQIASVLTAFTNANFKFSDPLPAGGKIADVFNQLTALYGPVTENCDNLPTYLGSLKDALATYIEMSGQAYILHSRAAQATAILNASIKNASQPKANNGGLQTNDSNYYVGFDKLPSANQLIGSLSTDKNAFSIHLTGDSFSESNCDISVESKTKFTIPILSLIRIQISHSSDITMDSYTSKESSFSMDITYPGLTTVGDIPLSLSNDQKTGWYAVNILEEIKNKTNDSTKDGYKLIGNEFTVEELFGKDGRLNFFKTFVISKQPTIDITFTKIDIDSFKKHIHTDNSVKVSLFGWISLGSVEHSYTLDTVTYNENEQSVSLHLSAPDISGSIPLEQQVAYVLGGVLNNTN